MLCAIVLITLQSLLGFAIRLCVHVSWIRRIVNGIDGVFDRVRIQYLFSLKRQRVNFQDTNLKDAKWAVIGSSANYSITHQFVPVDDFLPAETSTQRLQVLRLHTKRAKSSWRGEFSTTDWTYLRINNPPRLEINGELFLRNTGIIGTRLASTRANSRHPDASSRCRLQLW